MEGLNEIGLRFLKILELLLSTQLTLYFQIFFIFLILEKCIGWNPPYSILNLISAKIIQIFLWMMRDSVFMIFYAPHVKAFFQIFTDSRF